MDKEYTIREYLDHLGIYLNYQTRQALGYNAVKVAIRIDSDRDKKWKPEKNCRPKGARVWSIEVLKEVFDKGVVAQARRMMNATTR